jgi:hypothetical protein
MTMGVEVRKGGEGICTGMRQKSATQASGVERLEGEVVGGAMMVGVWGGGWQLVGGGLEEWAFSFL